MRSWRVLLLGTLALVILVTGWCFREQSLQVKMSRNERTVLRLGRVWENYLIATRQDIRDYSDTAALRAEISRGEIDCGGEERQLTHQEVVAKLVPEHTETVPERDPWGHEYQFTVIGDLLCVRSPGRDGIYESTSYEKGWFDPKDYDADVVALGHSYVRARERAKGWLDD